MMGIRKLLTLVLAVAAFNTTARPLKTIRSNQKNIYYFVNDEGGSWSIMPRLKPDRLEAGCRPKKNIVKFVTDIDSASFTVELGDTVRFYVLYDGDSALTEIVGVPKNVIFTEEYIKAHKGKTEVDIPEVHELVNIAIALTPAARKDSNMVDMTTGYYAEMVRYFDRYKNHPLIDTLHRQLALGEEGYYWYYAWKMNACAYIFDKQHIKNMGYIRDMGFGEPANPIPANLHLLEDFAKVSDFRRFYTAHKPYYEDLKKTYISLNPLNNMQQWLEQYFKREYGSYAVYFSPLVGGAHSTQRFYDNGFSQTVMFVCTADKYPDIAPEVNEMYASRVVFTEIDHNFVNPVSDRYYDEIDKVISNRGSWVDTAILRNSYNSPSAVFNEYMTWALFSLYCMDKYKPQHYNEYIPHMEAQMSRRRGFTRFTAFNRQLMNLYEKNRKISVDDLYKEMIAWCGKQ